MILPDDSLPKMTVFGDVKTSHTLSSTKINDQSNSVKDSNIVENESLLSLDDSFDLNFLMSNNSILGNDLNLFNESYGRNIWAPSDKFSGHNILTPSKPDTSEGSPELTPTLVPVPVPTPTPFKSNINEESLTSISPSSNGVDSLFRNKLKPKTPATPAPTPAPPKLNISPEEIFKDILYAIFHSNLKNGIMLANDTMVDILLYSQGLMKTIGRVSDMFIYCCDNVSCGMFSSNIETILNEKSRLKLSYIVSLEFGDASVTVNGFNSFRCVIGFNKISKFTIIDTKIDDFMVYTIAPEYLVVHNIILRKTVKNSEEFILNTHLLAAVKDYHMSDIIILLRDYNPLVPNTADTPKKLGIVEDQSTLISNLNIHISGVKSDSNLSTKEISAKRVEVFLKPFDDIDNISSSDGLIWNRLSWDWILDL